MIGKDRVGKLRKGAMMRDVSFYQWFLREAKEWEDYHVGQVLG